jgi:hypothetical protein
MLTTTKEVQGAHQATFSLQMFGRQETSTITLGRKKKERNTVYVIDRVWQLQS